MAKYDFDLLTIGAGSGGVAGSRRAGTHGAKVAIIESLRVGGTCVLRGCIPKKLLVYGAHFQEEFIDAAGFGWRIGDNNLDWAALVAAKDKELDRLNGIYVALLEKVGVTIIEGRGVLVDPHAVRIGDSTVTAERILIATGGWPTVPPIPGFEHAITSNEALDLKRLPRRMVIVGGGYIAVEFAGIFHAAGVEIEMVIRGDALLRGFDEDIRQHLTELYRARGIRIRTGSLLTAIEKRGAGLRATLGTGETIDAELILYATGRAPNTKAIGLEALGIATDHAGAVRVDDWQVTSIPNIYAVGDVTDRLNLTPVAIAEARAVADTLFGKQPTRFDREGVPTAVFSTPTIATVGLTEEQARAQHGEIDVYMSRFRPLKATLSGRDERTLMKLVVDRASDRVLGVHMVGPDAPEIVQGLAVALKAGATKRQFDQTVGIHPTAAEEFVTMRDKRPDPLVIAARQGEMP
jgi:glutathione reductase (NADPH)